MAPRPHRTGRTARGFGAWLPVRDPFHLAAGTQVRLRYDTGHLIGSTVIGYLRHRPLPGDNQLTLTGTEHQDAILPWPDHLDRWLGPHEQPASAHRT